MGAAIPFAPMIIGAGAGALLDKGNPLRGAMLGAAGGGIAAPAVTAMTGLGAAGASGGAMAGMSSLAGTEAAAGLPSMASVAGSMPGASTLPNMMAGGSGFVGNAGALGSAYNALPMAERLGALTSNGPGGLFKMPTPNKAMNMGRGLMQMGQQEPPPPMPQAPQQRPMMPPQQISRFMTSPLGRRM